MSLIARYKPNRVIDIKKTIADTPTEPVTLDEAKEWLVITFSDDDTIITNLIKQCRNGVEEFCQISLVEQQIVLTADLYESIELPYGPLLPEGEIEVKIKTGKDGSGVNTYDTLSATDYDLDGEEFKLFCPSRAGRYVITYDTGLPDGDLTSFGQSLKLDLLRIIAYCYEHRGDEALTTVQSGIGRSKSLDEALELFASKYRRMIWL